MKIKELLEAIQLIEATGGMAKRWLESTTKPHIFTDAQNNQYTIGNLLQFPLKQPQLPIEELLVEVQSAVEQAGLSMEQVNVVGAQPKQGAAMLVIMKDANDKLYPFIKFYRSRTMDNLGMHWSQADFARDTGLTWQETRMSGIGKDRQEEVITRVAAKPVDTVSVNTLVGANQVPNIVESTMIANGVDQTVAKAFSQLAANALSGKADPIEGFASYERDVRVDFGEVATPLALISGALAGGQYAQVQSELLGPMGVNWSSAKSIFYPAALNEPLYDSELVWNNEVTLRISNKAGGKGGAASLSSIAGVITKYPERFTAADRSALSGKYKKFVSVIDIIIKNKALPGMLAAAVALGYVTEQESEIVKYYHDNKIVSGTAGLTKTLVDILNNPSIFAAKTDKPDYAVCYHLTAALARLVVKDLNQDIALTTDFFRFILSKANLIQVNQFTKRTGDAVGWDRFDVVWPPVFVGKIKFDASDYQGNKPVRARLAFKT